MNIRRNLYNKLLIRVILPLTDLILGTEICRSLRLIEKMNKLSKEEITKWQNIQLQKLIMHVYNHTRYYHNLFDELGIDPATICNLNDLERIPAVNKEIFLNQYEDFIPDDNKLRKFKVSSTGGSTGRPFQHYLDLKTWSYITAAKIYAWQTTSYLYGDRYAVFGSSSLFTVNKRSLIHRIYFFIRKGIPLNGMNLSDTKLTAYINTLKKNKVKYIYGYASAVYLLAKFIKSNQIQIEIKGCFTTSEILTDLYRQTIEDALGCTVMDCYGARDGGITAFEVNPGQYHVGYNTLVEVVNCDYEDTGTLLVTDLFNYAFPFIRYEIGDEVTLPSDQNGFSYNGQVLTKIFGRVSDIIKLENGNVLTGPGFTILFSKLNVIAYKISKIGQMRLLVEIQKKETYTLEEEQLIFSTVKKHSGDDCDVILKYVEGFNEEKNGKRRYFISS